MTETRAAPDSLRDRLFDKYGGRRGPWRNVRDDVLALIEENDRLARLAVTPLDLARALNDAEVGARRFDLEDATRVIAALASAPVHHPDTWTA